MPVVAEKWINELKESEIEILQRNLFVHGIYQGSVLTACMAQQYGYINEEQKINLIEPARSFLYKETSKARGFKIETKINKIANKTFKGFICMPTTKP